MSVMSLQIKIHTCISETHAQLCFLEEKSLDANEINGATFIHTTCWVGSSFPLWHYTYSSDDEPMMNLYTAPMSWHVNVPSPSFPPLPAAAATVIQQQRTLKGWKRWDGTYILQGALESWWHEAWRSLTTYGLKHKQEMCIVFDHKGKKISLDITE